MSGRAVAHLGLHLREEGGVRPLLAVARRAQVELLRRADLLVGRDELHLALLLRLERLRVEHLLRVRVRVKGSGSGSG